MNNNDLSTNITDNKGLYSYEELLDKCYSIKNNDNTNNISQNMDQLERRSAIPAPKLEKKGGKRISWINFAKTCESINRDLEHVKLYILSELAAEGSLDGNNNLTIVGKFNSEMILTILKKYIQEYVICKSCQKKNTEIYRKNRLSIVKCNDCFSERTLDQIK